MDATQARKDLELKLAQRGIIGDAVETEIEKIVKSIPQLVRDQYDADDVVAAAQYADKYYAAMDGGAPVAQPTKAPTGGAVEVSIPAADLKAIQEFQSNTRAARTEKAQKTKITMLIGDKPYPGTYLKPDQKMTPKCDIAKFEAYRENLVDTPENKAAYEKCLEAIRNNTPMDIYIPEETKWNPRVIGAEVSTPAENGSALEQKPFDMKGLLAFVAYDLCGYIMCDANGIGAKLGTVRTKKSAKASSTQSALSPKLNLVNRKEAFQSPDKHMFASQVKKNGAEVLTKEGSVRSALSFQVYNGKTDAMGTKQTRTVRVFGRTQVPRWERKNAAFEDLFGATEKQTNVVTAPTTKERAAMDAIIGKTLYAIQANGSEYGDVAMEIEKQMAASSAARPATQDFA